MSDAATRAPYCGLVPYEEDDAAFFFGRTDDIGLVISNLLASRLTLFYGASGVGKSSVLNAGVVPALRQLAARNREDVGKPELAVVVFRNWAGAPALALTRAVRDACAEAAGMAAADSPQTESLVATLRRGGEQVGGQVLVILDQFEEHFQYPAIDDSESFDDAFVSALNDPTLPVNFLLSMREDGLAKLDRYKGRIPGLFDNYLRIQHLDAESAREAIEKPVERYNDLFRAGQPPIVLEDGLVTSVLNEVQAGRVTISDATLGHVEMHEGGERRVETPFLQLVMTRIWEYELTEGSTLLRESTFRDSLGGASSIVRNHVRSALDSLTPDEKELAISAFRFLVTPSLTKIAHSAQDLAALCEVPEPPLATLLEKLTATGYRILKPVPPPPDRPDAVLYEIWHDILARAILIWRAERVRESAVEATRAAADADLQAAQLKSQKHKAALRRSRRVTAAVSVSLLLSVILGALALFQWHRARDETQHARDEARRAQWHKQLADARVALSTDPQLGLLLARRVLRESIATDSGAAHEATDTLAMALAASRVRGHFKTGRSRLNVGRVAVAKVGADERVEVAVLGEEDKIHWLDPWSRDELRMSPAADSPVRDMAVAPDGSRIALILQSGALQIVDSAGEGSPRVLPSDAVALKVVWSPGGRYLAWSSGDGAVTVVDAVTLQKIMTLRPFEEGSGQWIGALAFSADEAWLAGGGSDYQVRLWSLSGGAAGQQRACFAGHTYSLYSVRFSPDGTMLASGSGDSTARLWDLRELEPSDDCTERALLRRLVGHFNTIFDVRFSPDGRTLATASADSSIQLWDVDTGKPVLSLLGHAAPVEEVDFLPDGERLVSVSWDGSARIWDTTDLPDVIASIEARQGTRCLVTLTRNGRAVAWESGTGEVFRQARFDGANLIAIDDGCRVAAVGYYDGSVVTHDVEGGEQLGGWQAHRGWLTAMAVSPDGKLVASAGHDGAVRIWNSRDGKVLHEKGDFVYVVETLSFSPDGRFLLAGDDSGEALLWDIAGDKQVRLPGHSQYPRTVAWSGDGKWLATGSQDTTARLWSLPGGAPGHTIPHSDMVLRVAFDASRRDGLRLLTLSGQFAYQWQARDGSRIEPALEGHENLVTGGAYSPDGTRIATSGWDRMARIWDAASGRLLATYTHERPLSNAIFSPDGEALLTISEAGEVRYIPLDAARLLQTADERATRELTPAECKKYLNLDRC